MKTEPTLGELKAFAKIAAHRSFRKAATDLSVTPSTLSHLMRDLEKRLDVRLLNRTTRSVSVTEAGEQLLSRLKPLIAGLEAALGELDTFRDHPSGTLRINTTETAARLLIAEVVPEFLRCNPDMSIDIVTENKLVDIVEDGFDAGVRLVTAVPQDMIAIRFGGDFRFLAVASPDYVRANGRPKTPDDLLNHPCIRIRMPSSKPYRWEFAKHGQEMSIDVRGPVIVDHVELMAQLAINGLGIAYISNKTADPYINDGKLVSVLDDWCPVISSLCLYYPGHRHVPNGLRAFIEILKRKMP